MLYTVPTEWICSSTYMSHKKMTLKTYILEVFILYKWLKCPFSWQIDKMWISHKIETIKRNELLDIFHNIDEPWKHDKWKKPVTKSHILYDSIHMKYL